jgi:hypothetical protein
VDHELVLVREGAHGISNLTAGEQTRVYQAGARFLFHRL